MWLPLFGVHVAYIFNNNYTINIVLLYMYIYIYIYIYTCIYISHHTIYSPAASMTHSVQLWLETQRYLVQIPATSNVCQIQCSKLFKVLSMVLRTIRNTWNYSIRVGHSHVFGLHSVVILPWYFRKWRKAIFTHSYDILTAHIEWTWGNFSRTISG